MFYSEKIDESVYSDLMEQIKKVNADWLRLRTSKEYRIGLVVEEVIRELSHLKVRAFVKSVNRWFRGIKSRKVKSAQGMNKKIDSFKSNYFSNDKIAVYTAVFGAYDRVLEPYCTPDNCDFYIFTDQEFHDSRSVWKREALPEKLRNLNNAGKNRYLKMHPHELFPNYKYSVYVDGNVHIMTDLTEYINRIGEIGLATHQHDTRNCVFDELEAVRKTKRETKENVERHRNYLCETGMPKEYGLLQCNVIAREHHNNICISLMSDWWKEYSDYTKRDQISLPHVLYRHQIKTEEIGVLGKSVYKNPSFRILTHI